MLTANTTYQARPELLAQYADLPPTICLISEITKPHYKPQGAWIVEQPTTYGLLVRQIMNPAQITALYETGN